MFFKNSLTTTYLVVQHPFYCRKQSSDLHEMAQLVTKLSQRLSRFKWPQLHGENSIFHASSHEQRRELLSEAEECMQGKE